MVMKMEGKRSPATSVNFSKEQREWLFSKSREIGIPMGNLVKIIINTEMKKEV